MTNKKRAFLSLSGGMDSTSLMIHLLANDYHVTAIGFDYGQKHKIELERSKSCISYLNRYGLNVKHSICDLSSYMSEFHSALTSLDTEVPEGHYEESNMTQTVVPNRNVIFSSLVYGLAQSVASKTKQEVIICLGLHQGDHAIYKDCTPESKEAVEHAFKISNYDSELVSYYTPYMMGNKTSILRDCFDNCKKLHLDFDIVMRNTITSYNPDSQGRSSGKSGSDIERIEAFLNIDRKDPIEYVDGWEKTVQHAKEVLKRE